MSSKWFVQKDGVVEGPFFTEDVQKRLHVGKLNAGHLIWAQGLTSWQTLDTWAKDLPALTKMVLSQPSTRQVWHYANGGESFGPFSQEMLVRELKNVSSMGGVLVWTTGMKEWEPIFEFHEILKLIGVNKRQFPRADLTGKVILNLEGVSSIASLLSISEGGFGMTVEKGVSVGEKLEVELKSPAFRNGLRVNAEVRYINGSYVGMKFANLSAETRGMIIQYIKQSQERFAIKVA